MGATRKEEFIRRRNSVYSLHVHLVFVSKYRRRVFSAKMLGLMNEIFSNSCSEHSCNLLEFDGESDHVHALVRYPPKIAIGQLVHALKRRSSRLMRKQFPELRKRYWRGVLWSPSYFAASCGGAPIDVVKKYIENQATPS
jgi:putative transposase